MPKEIKIWTLHLCPWCTRAKKLMDKMGWEYEEIHGKHPDWKTVPYICIDGEPIGGFTEFARYLRT